MSEQDKATRQKVGLEWVEKVYGPGSSQMMAGQKGPFVEEIIEHMFGEIWSRPGLTVRERRLLVLGATTMLGREDLIEIQLRGALANGEFTDEQLEELPLMMLFYAGAGNTTALVRGIQAAKAKKPAK